MTNVLLITVIGMGLVFVVILLLWGMMELLVRAFADKKPAAVAAEVETAAPAPLVAGARQQKAAAVAVAAALRLRRYQAATEAVRQALASQTPGQRRHQAAVEAVRQALLLQGSNPTVQVVSGQTSNWQSVMRSVQRQNQASLFTRASGKPTA